MNTQPIYKKILYLLSHYWYYIAGSIAAALLYVIFNSASIWFAASLLNSVLSNFKELLSEHEALKNASEIGINQQLKYWSNQFILRGTAMETLKVLSIVIIVVFVLKNVFLYIKNVLLTIVQYKFITVLRDKLFKRYLSLSLTYFNRRKSGELTSIVINDVSNMQRAFTVGFQQAMTEPLNILVFTILLFIINLKLALIATITIPLTAFLITKIGRIIRRRSRRIAGKIADITHRITETLSAMRVVKAFTTEETELHKFQNETSKFYHLIMRRTRLRLLAVPSTEIIVVVVVVVLLLIGGRDVLVLKTMTSEDFIRFILVLFSMLTPIRLLSNVNMEIQEGLASAERVFNILDAVPGIQDLSNSREKKTFKNSIQFDKVHFSYNGEEEIVLKDISLEMKKGEIVALVGESGAGKSTIADLIPRFYDVTSGAIKIDGQDIREVKVKSLRQLMGIVTQETILFNDSIKANISYGSKIVDDEAIISAAKAANAFNFIQEQPQGLDTIIGDRGVKLSGGQQQRLAIARAILINPPILILDEATSSLDTRSEKLVRDALEKLMSKRTVLVIAHRLSTVQNANKIIVIDKGRIIESGKHEALLEKGGVYRRLYRYQFESSQPD